jgi:hypothetical protein
MMAEHDAAGYILGRMREASSDYAVPPDGCISYKTLYCALTALEVDLHQHIPFENKHPVSARGAMEDLSCSIYGRPMTVRTRVKNKCFHAMNHLDLRLS